MTTLRLEVNLNGEWHQTAALHAGDQYGSISNHGDDGSRDVYVFGVNPVDNVGEINRSVGGMDIETGTIREVTTLGLEPIARLNPGQHHEMQIRTPRSASAVVIRFAYS